MSTIDERVVEMRFDNAQFESGAKESMSTLDKLKDKLDIDPDGKAFSGIKNGISTFQNALSGLKFDKIKDAVGFVQQAVNNVKLNKISDQLDILPKKLSSFGQIFKEEWNRLISQTIIQGISKLTTAIPNQIKTGGWNRALNLENANFQLTGLGIEWKNVSNDLSYAVNQTAYGLDAAAKVAGQLAASGIKAGDAIITTSNDVDSLAESLKGVTAEAARGNGTLDEMSTALRSISGVAAMTNSSYEDIGNIYTRVAGQGRVMATDLNSLAARGINAAATLANALGVTEAEVRDMTSKGQISFQMFSDAMYDAYADHAVDANNTFQGALANTKSALGRIGADVADDLLPAMTKVLNSARVMINSVHKVIQPVLDSIGRFVVAAGTTLSRVFDNINTHLQPFIGMTKGPIQVIATLIDFVTKKVEDLGNAVRRNELLNKVNDTVKTVKEGGEVVSDVITKTQEKLDELSLSVIRGDWGNNPERQKRLTEAGYSYELVQNKVNELLGCSYRYEVQTGKTTKAVEKQTKSTKELTKELKSESLVRFALGIVNIGKTINLVITSIKDSVSKVFKSIDQYKVAQKLLDISKTFEQVTGVFVKDTETIERVKTVIDNVVQGIAGIVHGVAQVVGALVGAIAETFIELNKTPLVGLSEGFRDFGKSLELTENQALGLKEVFKLLLSPIKAIVPVIQTVIGWMLKLGSGIVNLVQHLLDIFGFGKKASDGIKDFGDNAADAAGKVKISDGFKNFIQGLKDLKDAVGERLTGAIKTVGDAIKQIVDNVKESEGFKNFVDAFTKLKDALTENLVTIIGGVADAISKLFGNFKEEATTKVSEASNSLKELGDNANGVDNDKITSISDALSKFFDKLAEITTGITDFVKNNRVLKAMGNAIKSVGGAIKQFLSNVKNSKGFEKFNKALNNFKKIVGNKLEKAFNSVTDFFSKLSDKKISSPKLSKVADVFSAIIEKVGEFIETLTELISGNISLPTAISNLFSGIGEAFSNIHLPTFSGFSGIKEFFGLFSGLKGSGTQEATEAVEEFDEAVDEDTIVDKAEAMKEAAGAMLGIGGLDLGKLDLSKIKQFFGLEDKQKKQESKKSTKKTKKTTSKPTEAQQVGGSGVADADTDVNLLSQLGQKISDFVSEYDWAGLGQKVRDGLGKFFDAVGEVFSNPVLSNLKDNILELIKTILILKAIKGMTSAIEGLGNVGAAMTAVLNTVNKKLRGGGESKSIAAKFKDVAIGIGIIAASIGGLSYLVGAKDKDGNNLAHIPAAMGILLACIAAAAAVPIALKKFGKVDSNYLTRLAGYFKELSITIGVMSFSVIALGLMPVKVLVKGIASLGVIMLVFGGLFSLFAFIASKLKFIKQSGKIFIRMAAAIALMVIPIAVLGLMPWSIYGAGLLKASIVLGIFIAVIAILAVINKRIGGIESDVKTSTLVGLAIDIVAMAVALSMLNGLKMPELLVSALALSMVILALGGALKLAGNYEGSTSTALSFAATAAAVGFSLFELCKVTNGKYESMLSAGAAMAMAFAALGYAFKIAGDNEHLCVAALSLAGVAFVVGLSLTSLASVGDWKSILAAGASLGGAMLLIALAAKIASSAQNGAGAMITLAIAAIIVAGALTILSLVPIAELGKGLIALAAGLFIVGAAGFILGKLAGPITAGSIALAGFSASCLTFAAAIAGVAIAVQLAANVIGRILSAFGGKIGKIGKSLKKATDIDISGMADDIAGGANKIKNALSDGGDDISKETDKVGKKIKKSGNTITANAAEVGDNTAEVVDEKGQVVTEKAEGAAVDAVSGASETITANQGSIIEGTDGFFGELIGTITANGGDVSSAISGLFDGDSIDISSLTELANQAGIEIPDSIINGITSGEIDVDSVISQFGGGANWDTLQSKSNELYGYGNDGGQGYDEGIQNGSSGTYDTMSNAATNGVTGAQSQSNAYYQSGYDNGGQYNQGSYDALEETGMPDKAKEIAEKDVTRPYAEGLIHGSDHIRLAAGSLNGHVNEALSDYGTLGNVLATATNNADLVTDKYKEEFEGGGAQKAAEAARQLPQSAASALDEAGDTSAVTNAANSTIYAYTGTLSGGETQVANAAIGLRNAAASGLSSDLSAFSSAGESAANAFLSGLSSVDVSSAGTSLVSSVSSAVAASNEAGTLKNAGMNAANSFVSGVGSYNNLAKKAGNSLGTSVSTGARNSTKSLLSSGKSAGKSYASGITSAAKGARNAGGTLAANASIGAKGASSKFKSYGSSAGQSFVSGVQSRRGSATSAGRALSNAAANGARNASSMRSAGTSAGQGYASGVSSKSGSARTAGTKLKNSAVSAARGGYSGFYSAGVQAAQGFTNGINSKANAAATAARRMVTNAIKAARKAADEHSPSKITYEIGKFFVLGFSNAIEDTGYLASKESRNMVKSALATLNNAVSINDILGDKLSSAPSITPVIDDSKIISGINGIDNAFTASKLYNFSGMNSNYDKLNDIADSINSLSNGDVVSAINTLRSDIDNLGSKIAAMQIVLDTGVIAGGVTDKVSNNMASNYSSHAAIWG